VVEHGWLFEIGVSQSLENAAVWEHISDWKKLGLVIATANTIIG